MKKKMAVTGFGFMGAVHAKNILENERLELCAIVDNRDSIFEGIEKTGNHGELGLPIDRLKKVPVYKTLEECVSKEQPDAVSICVPLFLHYELTRKALNLGLDVLLEKPFCPAVEQCDELINLAEEKGRILMVAHCVRFFPAWQFLSECIRDKRYGELKLLTASRMGGEPAWGVWLDDKIKKTCGGALLDLLIHDIDFAISCFGKPEDVELNLNVAEYWEFELKYKTTPARISIKGGFLHRHTAFASEYIATFDKGSVRYSSLQPEFIYAGTDAGSETIEVKGDGYANELDYFAGCIEARKPPIKCLPEESLTAISVCNQIKESKHNSC
ncbi:MAG: Gfo/Idh/MocA family oxidoreductase [Victivallales bacterium]|nr:Gfo/Idh/MocA family oxidoreductase [Victivallales bacterium]